ncbi:MAG: peptidase domain-containing ABC transporter [Cyclobacteriaceae bacterium]
MLNTDHIIRIITESCLYLDQHISSEVIRALNRNYRFYKTAELEELKRDLSEAGYQAGLQLLEYRLHPEELKRFFNQPNQAVLVFHREKDEVIPKLITGMGKKSQVTSFLDTDLNRASFSFSDLNADYEPDGQITVFSIMKLENLVSDHFTTDFEPTPLARFFRLLKTEKKDILYILFYAFFIGLISLAIPLGIQTTVELISGGLFFSSVYILIGGVIIAVLMVGGMQVFQLMLVEFLQRRIFTRAAFEFAYRMPRLDTRSIDRVYAPGLANRFFDVLTIQKGLPKFLIEFSGAALQILFGLALLSLYHPLFVFFGVALVTLLIAIFYFSGPKALSTSIQESSYKYKLIHWLEDLARMHHTIKLTGTTSIPVSKTDFFVNNYLKNRKSHFKILLFQFTYTVIFKAVIIGGLLIIGTVLVVQREITLGQFVASEVIIILILTSVEKIIMYMDVIYDLLTAVDKIGSVTDLPLERRGGLDMTKVETAFSLSFKKVHTKNAEGHATINGLTFDINPGERVCIAGPSGSGKSTLADLMTGMVSNYDGAILVNGFALRDLDLTYYRDHISANGPTDDLFEGTLIDNILIGNPKLRTTEAIEAMDKAGLKELVASWPKGIDTPVTSEGKGFSSGISHRIMIARALVRKPKLMILHDHFSGLTRREKMEIFSQIFSEKNSTVICFSNDPLVMGACDRVLLLEAGQLKAAASYRELLQNGLLNDLKD